MSFFAKFNRPGTTPITPQKYTVKTVKVNSESRPKSDIIPLNTPRSVDPGDIRSKPGADRVTPLRSFSHANSRRASFSSRKRKHPDGTATSKGASSPNMLKPPSPESVSSSRNRHTISLSRSPLSVRLESSDEGSDSGQDAGERASKRYKSVSPTAPVDKHGRKLVNPLSFRRSPSTSPTEDVYFVHAEQVANIVVKSGGKNPTRGMGKNNKSPSW